MTASYAKWLEELAELAEAQGWTVAKATSGHMKFFDPNGIFINSSSGTAFEGPIQQKIISQLKRAGLKIGNGEREVLMVKRKKKSVQPYLKQLFGSAPEKVWLTSELMDRCKAHLGMDLGDNSVYQALRTLWGQGSITKLSPQEWRMVRPPLPEQSRPLDKPVEPQSPPALAPAMAQNPTVESVALSDEDEKILSNALNALAELEGLIKRQRSVAEMIVKLKETLK